MGAYSSTVKKLYAPILYRSPETSYSRDDVIFIENQIAAMWLPYPDSEFTILYSHGTGKDLGKIKDAMIKLGQDQKCNILMWDYPGYGHSSGTASEESLCLAVEKVYSYYFTHHRTSKLILMGTSLGSGPTCYLAAKLSQENFDYDGVLLECPFSSIVSVVLPHTIPQYTQSVDSFLNYERIKLVTKPVYIIHGDQDIVIPWMDSLTLAQNCPSLWKFWKVEGGTHSNLRTHSPEEYTQNFQDFLHII